VAAQAIERLVSGHRPDLANGRWIDAWRVDRVWPDADLIALTLDRQGRAGVGARDRAMIAELLRDDRFRRAIGANEHDGVEWFNKERFEHALDFLRLQKRAELKRGAENAGYRLDQLEAAVAESQRWVSTRSAARPIPRHQGSTKASRPSQTKTARK
jgi:hypothetical protein